jgi:cyclic beta-1,2-glucan synthetase
LSFADELQSILNSTRIAIPRDPSLQPLAARLSELLSTSLPDLRGLSADLGNIERTAERLAQETEFGFLVDPYRQILSIGYEMGEKKRHEACYDLIASEARIATFLAIARDDLLQQSWAKLGRDHARANGRFLLLSWSGTMFEYLMPALWMRSYPGHTDRTHAGCRCLRTTRLRPLARHSLGHLGVGIFKEERPRRLPLFCLRPAQRLPVA